MKITDVRVRRLSCAYNEPLDVYSDTAIVNATDIYPDFRRHAAAARVTITPVKGPDGALTLTQDYLQIDTDAGISGVVGPITFPGITYYLLNHIKYTLLGQDPMRITYLSDILYRIGLDQTAGDMTRAASHAEAALWDIKCKYLNVPLYELLGGKVRERAPAYVNTAGLPHTDEVLLPIVRQHTQDGAPGVKIYAKYGPREGTAGIRATKATLEKVREAVGPDAFIALEAVCCWDYTYALELARAIEPIGIAWLEEPCLPDRMDEYARLRKVCPIPISAGEHSVRRWQFRDMMDKGAADIYQPEPMWCGGIGEAMSIIDLAGCHNRLIYIHSCIPNVDNHILIASNPTVCPMTEYLLTINRAAQYFLKYPSEPVHGMVAPPETPGIGCDIDESKVEHELWLD